MNQSVGMRRYTLEQNNALLLCSRFVVGPTLTGGCLRKLRRILEREMMQFEVFEAGLLALRNRKSDFTRRVAEERVAEEFGATQGAAAHAQYKVFCLPKWLLQYAECIIRELARDNPICSSWRDQEAVPDVHINASQQ